MKKVFALPWINVVDGLPDEGSLCLIVKKRRTSLAKAKHYIALSMFMDNKWEVFRDSDSERVTHWVPIDQVPMPGE